jgi:ubiquinone/menaquinone biosynthesis C-methylase UbiE
VKSVRRFEGKVADYARHRERYSRQILLPILQSKCGLIPEWVVADIGAGTGMLSDVFLANGNHTIAVEPNVEMREMCRSLHEGNALLEVREGTAEQTGLEHASVDLVSAGRAMHWFNLERSMAEFRRILKPDGWVAIIAFGRTEEGHEENEALERVLREYSEDHADTHAGYDVYRNLAKQIPRDFHHEQLLSSMAFDWEGLHGMVMSLSASPLPGDSIYPDFVQALRALFERYARDGKFVLQTRYWINLGRFATA